MSVGQAIDEIVPIFFIACFIDPVFERSIVVNGHFRDIRKKEAKVLHNKIFVVKEGTPDTTNIVSQIKKPNKYCLGNQTKFAIFLRNNSDCMVVDFAFFDTISYLSLSNILI